MRHLRPLFSYFLPNLSIEVSGAVKSPTIIVFISAFISINICFIDLGAPMLGV